MKYYKYAYGYWKYKYTYSNNTETLYYCGSGTCGIKYAITVYDCNESN